MKLGQENNHAILLWGLIHALIFTYALIPFLVDFYGFREIPWSQVNLIYSAFFSICLVGISISKNIRLPKFSLCPKHETSNKALISVFFVAAVIFYYFPWHEDRVSAGSKFAAFFRAAWLYVIFSLNTANELKKLVAISLTMILMFIDESRTTFTLAIFFLAITSKHKYLLLPVGLAMILLLAAIRMSKFGGLIAGIWYGLFGEAYNGAFPVSQVVEVVLDPMHAVVYTVNVILQPISYVILKLVGIFSSDANTLNAHSILVEQVRVTLGEKLAPMGGWYLPASFVHLGWLGIPAMAAYTIVIMAFTKCLFGSKEFPYHLLFIFIAIKAAPHVYVNFCLYYAVAFYIFGIVRKIKF